MGFKFNYFFFLSYHVRTKDITTDVIQGKSWKPIGLVPVDTSGGAWRFSRCGFFSYVTRYTFNTAEHVPAILAYR